jgi:hypothetical protein
MKELLGVVVLSMPILAVLCIGGLAGYAGWAAGRQMSEVRKKWMVRVAAASAVVFLFACDEIVGRSYLHYLCATEGGTKVYRHIRLPPEYWRADGSPIFIDEKGNKIASRLDDDYQFGSTSDEHYSKVFRIREFVNVVLDRKKAETVGTYTHFAFFGGWLVNFTSLDVAGVGCPSERDFYRKFLQTIFIH